MPLLVPVRGRSSDQSLHSWSSSLAWPGRRRPLLLTQFSLPTASVFTGSPVGAAFARHRLGEARARVAPVARLAASTSRIGLGVTKRSPVCAGWRPRSDQNRRGEASMVVWGSDGCSEVQFYRGSVPNERVCDQPLTGGTTSSSPAASMSFPGRSRRRSSSIRRCRRSPCTGPRTCTGARRWLLRWC